MLSIRASRSLFTTLPRVHVRSFAATFPLQQDHGSRPPRSKGPSTENGPESEPSSLSSSDQGGGIEHAQSVIRRWTERNSIAFRQHTDSLIPRMAISFTRLGGEINRVTGYDEIETLKRQVVSQGTSGYTSTQPMETQIHRGSHFWLKEGRTRCESGLRGGRAETLRLAARGQ
jgi:hypothetical protein